jgi:predicted  nucleic acid-binding Zn-ribbon protein
MNFRQKVWDFFKQKDDIVDRELIKKIGTSITDLNRRVHNVEIAIKDLEKNQSSKSDTMSSLKSEIENLKFYIKEMDNVYSFKISKLSNKQNDKK